MFTSRCVADLIKKLELCLMVVSVLPKIEFGHTQISVPKIGIPMLKAAYINPWLIWALFSPSMSNFFLSVLAPSNFRKTKCCQRLTKAATGSIL